MEKPLVHPRCEVLTGAAGRDLGGESHAEAGDAGDGSHLSFTRGVFFALCWVRVCGVAASTANLYFPQPAKS